MLLTLAVEKILQLTCRTATGTIPRGKDLLQRVSEIDPEIGEHAKRFLGGAPFSDRLAAAEWIADRVLGVRGFFPWDSGPEGTPTPT